MKHPPLVRSGLIAFATLSLPCALAAQSSAVGEETVNLSAFVVESERATGYRASNSISGTRTNVALAEVPIAIQVLTEDLITDTGSLDALEALRYAASVTPSGSGDEFGQRFAVRGFTAQFNLRNGFPTGLGEGRYSDASNIARVEVVKGPSSVLYGQVAPGGVINVISKQPQTERATSVRAGIGTEGFYQAMLDATGSIDEGQRAAYRLTAGWLHEETNVDYEQTERFTVTPAVSWRVTDKVTLRLEHEYLEQDYTPDPGIPSITIAGGLSVYDRTAGGWGYRFSHLGPNSYIAVEQNTTQAEVEVALTPDLTYRFAYLAQYYDFETHRRVGTENAFAGRAFPERYEWRDEAIFGQKHDLLYTYQTGSVSHKLLLAFENRRTREDRERYQSAVAALPVNDPVALRARIEGPLAPISSLNRQEAGGSTTRTDGLLLTNQATLADDRLHALVGLRYDESESASNVSSFETDATTWQGGLVYDLRPDFSVYTTYSTSFLPNIGVDRNGAPLEPQTGEGFDLGFKFGLLNQRLTGTVAYFDITRTDIPRQITFQDDPATPENEFDQFVVLSGEERVRGIDFDLVYNPTDAWQVLLSGVYLDGEVVSDEQDPRRNGLPLEDASPFAFSLWNRFTFQSGPLRGLTLGGGLNYERSYPVESLYARRERRTDGGAVVDLMARYSFQAAGNPVAITLNLHNVADRVFIQRQDEWSRGFRARLAVRYDF